MVALVPLGTGALNRALRPVWLTGLRDMGVNGSILDTTIDLGSPTLLIELWLYGLHSPMVWL